jgi:hypothetical protein
MVVGAFAARNDVDRSLVMSTSSLQPRSIDLVLESYRSECGQVLDDLSGVVDQWWYGVHDAAAEALSLVGWLIDMSNAVRHRRLSELSTGLHDFFVSVDITARFSTEADAVLADEDQLLVLDAIAGIRRVLDGGRCRPDLLQRLEAATTVELIDQLLIGAGHLA